MCDIDRAKRVSTHDYESHTVTEHETKNLYFMCALHLTVSNHQSQLKRIHFDFVCLCICSVFILCLFRFALEKLWHPVCAVRPLSHFYITGNISHLDADHDL